MEAVQDALAPLSGVEPEDQILMHDGTRLDPAKSLANYSLGLQVSAVGVPLLGLLG